MWLLITCLVNLCVFVLGQTESNPQVYTWHGRVDGIRGDDFNMFLGVPYAQVDETKPFAPAIALPETLTKIIAAVGDQVLCPQNVNGIPKGSIQCLHLNIYTPHIFTRNSKFPVMVYLHGGGFVSGNGNLATFSPKFLVQHDVIVVTVNYRLGMYGFLCLPGSEINNQGLKDQKLALKWLRTNIHLFGGNFRNIVLFGHSAGSISAELHLLYNKDRDLNKFILQSGPAVSPLMLLPPAGEEYMRKLSRKLRIDVENKSAAEMLSALSNVSTYLITSATKGDEFRPCIDGKFIRTKPTVNVKNKKVIIGSTDREMLYFYQDSAKLETMVAAILKNSTAVNMPSVYKPADAKDSVLNFGNDLFFEHPISRSVRYYSENGATVYKYLFTYDGERNYLKVKDHIIGAGATHGDELGYIFDVDIFGKSIKRSDQILINDMTAMWTNFAYHGNPTPLNSSIVTTDNATLTWPPVDSSKKILTIGNILKVENDKFNNRTEFWTNFYKGKAKQGIDFGDMAPSAASSNKASVVVAIALSCIVRVLQFKST